MIPNFFYTPDILNYDFGPRHPLKPRRLALTIELLERYGLEWQEPLEQDVSDLLRVHGADYVDAVRKLDPVTGSNPDPKLLQEYGFGAGDNPAFPGMFNASLAYSACTSSAAKAVRDGEALAFAIGGGLHHALSRRASGFCIFDDPAIACHILLERFDRVAYADIDVHHGDGVQWIFYDDPRVLTCSIHETGRTLFPGTGFVEETGAAFTSLNVPLEAKTGSRVWLDAFRRGILPALEAFAPGAVVLQMGADPHFLDPLGHLMVDQQTWVQAVRDIQALALPTVALGGGGYNLSTVPRMWASAVLALSGVPHEDELPADLANRWGVQTYSDQTDGSDDARGDAAAEAAIHFIQREHLPALRASR